MIKKLFHISTFLLISVFFTKPIYSADYYYSSTSNCVQLSVSEKGNGGAWLGIYLNQNQTRDNGYQCFWTNDSTVYLGVNGSWLGNCNSTAFNVNDNLKCRYEDGYIIASVNSTDVCSYQSTVYNTGSYIHYYDSNGGVPVNNFGACSQPTPTPTTQPTPTPAPIILPEESEENLYLHETCLLSTFEIVPDLEYSTCTNDHPRCYKNYQGNETQIMLPVKQTSDLGTMPLFVYLKTNSFDIPLNAKVLGQSFSMLGQGAYFSYQLRDDYWSPYNHNSVGDVYSSNPDPFINTTLYGDNYYTLETYQDFDNTISANDISTYFNQDNYKTLLVIKNYDENNGVNLKIAKRCVWYQDNNSFNSVECTEENLALCSQYKHITPDINPEIKCSATDLDCHLTKLKAWFVDLFVIDTDYLSEVISLLFLDFEESIDSNIASIISAPLTVIGDLTTAQCTPLNLPLPFVDENLQLPCFRDYLDDKFPTFFVLWDLITTGVISYYVVLGIFRILKNTKDPDNDKIEVMDI